MEFNKLNKINLLGSLVFCFLFSISLFSCFKKSIKKNNYYEDIENVSITKLKEDLSPKYVNYYGVKVRVCSLPKNYVAKINNFYVPKEDYKKLLEEVLRKSTLDSNSLPLITKLDIIFSIFYKKALEEDIEKFFKNSYGKNLLYSVLNGNFSSFNYTLDDIQTKNVCLKLNDNVIQTLKEEIKEYKLLKDEKRKDAILKSIKSTIYFNEKVLKPLHLPEIVFYNWYSKHYDEISKYSNQSVIVTNLKYLGNYTFWDEDENKKINLKNLKGACLAQDLYINGKFIAEKGTPLNIVILNLPKNFEIKVMYINENDKTLEIFCQVYLDNAYQKLLFNLIKNEDFCIDINKL